MREKLEQILAAYEELTAKLADPAVLSDQKEYTRLAKAQRAQAPLAEKAREFLSAANQLEDAKGQLQEAFEELKKVELLDERDQVRERAEENAREQAALDAIGSLRNRPLIA